MDKIFLVACDYEYTYSDLINDINKKDSFSNYIYVKRNHPYKIFLNILHSILYDFPIEILDGDFSSIELMKLGIDKDEISEKTIEDRIYIKSFDEIIKRIELNKKWSISLYTSGVTGLPKKVTHTVETITRNVRIGEKHSESIWGYAYNPTHMAGLQVFFQSILNKNTIVYIFNDEIIKAREYIEKFKITNISATSTYYRQLYFHLKDCVFKNVRYITFGGERYDKNIQSQISEIFPNAKFRNIYASTEAGSLFNSGGEVLIIPDNIKTLIKINDDKEMLIHNSLLGNSDSFVLENGWYNTKDIVEIIDGNSFKFLTRESDLINIGGYKVNPLEIEEILLAIKGIKNVRVYAIKNSITGNIIAADIVIEDIEKEKEMKKAIRKYSKENLQEWKIPRIINIVDNIKQTRTGKKVRK